MFVEQIVFSSIHLLRESKEVMQFSLQAGSPGKRKMVVVKLIDYTFLADKCNKTKTELTVFLIRLTIAIVLLLLR
jgi:hypothetical protein